MYFLQSAIGRALFRPIVFIISLSLILQSLPVWAGESASFSLPKPGQMVNLSPAFSPAVLKGIKLDPKNPFRFHFYVDQGDSKQEQLKTESQRLIKYFLASLTIPEKDLWVNLSPYEKDRIIPDAFGQTEMGRDLLAQDYILKQITASLIYPESQMGKQFWDKVYKEAKEKYGTTEIPINTFNKVWIMPEKAVVYENNGTAYVLENHLKVMLEQDYLAITKNSPPLEGGVRGGGDTSALGSQIVREIVIPALTKEVNEGKNFAQLRQVFYSLILATWYKTKIKESILNKVYADKAKVGGVEYNSTVIPAKAGIQDTEAIYQQYLQAFKKGVFNYIKEDLNLSTQQLTPRKYFSGGVIGAPNLKYVTSDTISPAQVANISKARLVGVDGKVRLNPAMSSGANKEVKPADAAMNVSLEGGRLLDVKAIDWIIERIEKRVKQEISGELKEKAKELFQLNNLAEVFTNKQPIKWPHGLLEENDKVVLERILYEAGFFYNDSPVEGVSLLGRVGINQDSWERMKRAREVFRERKNTFIGIGREYWEEELPRYKGEVYKLGPALTQEPKASLLIVSLIGTRYEALLKRLDEITLSGEKADTEIIVTIADKENFTLEKLEAIKDKAEKNGLCVTVVVSNKNTISTNRNLAASLARGQYFVFLDDDVSMVGPVIQRLGKALEDYPELGIVSLPTYNKDSMLFKPIKALKFFVNEHMMLVNLVAGMVMATRAEIYKAAFSNPLLMNLGDDNLRVREAHALGFLSGYIIPDDAYTVDDIVPSHATTGVNALRDTLIEESFISYFSREFYNKRALDYGAFRLRIYNKYAGTFKEIQDFWVEFHGALLNFLDKETDVFVFNPDEFNGWTRKHKEQIQKAIDHITRNRDSIRTYKDNKYKPNNLSGVDPLFSALNLTAGITPADAAMVNQKKEEYVRERMAEVKRKIEEALAKNQLVQQRVKEAAKEWESIVTKFISGVNPEIKQLDTATEYLYERNGTHLAWMKHSDGLNSYQFEWRLPVTEGQDYPYKAMRIKVHIEQERVKWVSFFTSIITIDEFSERGGVGPINRDILYEDPKTSWWQSRLEGLERDFGSEYEYMEREEKESWLENVQNDINDAITLLTNLIVMRQIRPKERYMSAKEAEVGESSLDLANYMMRLIQHFGDILPRIGNGRKIEPNDFNLLTDGEQGADSGQSANAAMYSYPPKIKETIERIKYGQDIGEKELSELGGWLRRESSEWSYFLDPISPKGKSLLKAIDDRDIESVLRILEEVYKFAVEECEEEARGERAFYGLDQDTPELRKTGHDLDELAGVMDEMLVGAEEYLGDSNWAIEWVIKKLEESSGKPIEIMGSELRKELRGSIVSYATFQSWLINHKGKASFKVRKLAQIDRYEWMAEVEYDMAMNVAQRITYKGVELWGDSQGKPYYLKVSLIEQEHGAHDDGFPKSKREYYVENLKGLQRNLKLLNPDAQQKIAHGNVLLIGPGNHPYEILRLLDVLPNVESITVVDVIPSNLKDNKERLAKLLPRKMFEKIRFENKYFGASDLSSEPQGKYDLVVSDYGVFESSIYLSGASDGWKLSVKRCLDHLRHVLKPTGAFVTILADSKTARAFHENGFYLRNWSGREIDQMGHFIAVRDENLFRQNPGAVKKKVSASESMSSGADSAMSAPISRHFKQFLKGPTDIKFMVETVVGFSIGAGLIGIPTAMIYAVGDFGKWVAIPVGIPMYIYAAAWLFWRMPKNVLVGSRWNKKIYPISGIKFSNLSDDVHLKLMFNNFIDKLAVNLQGQGDPKGYFDVIYKLLNLIPKFDTAFPWDLVFSFKDFNLIKKEAQRAIQEGFDYNDPKEVVVAFIGLILSGMDNITWNEFKERVGKLAEFDKKYPGYWKNLFVKDKDLPTLTVSATEYNAQDIRDLDARVFKDHLGELSAIQKKINGLKWIEKDFSEDSKMNLRNIYWNVKRNEAIRDGRITEKDRFSMLYPTEELMQEEVLKDKREFYKVVFKIAYSKSLGGQSRLYLELMRDLIIADILLDASLARQLGDESLEQRIEAVRIFYESYLSHLPQAAVERRVDGIKGLKSQFEELSAKVYREITKIKKVKVMGVDSYTLVPQGFLSVFRGRAGISDCSFDMFQGRGHAFTRAMHEDTIYYYVYKGNTLKGYVGLMKGVTEEGEKVLVVDTVQSASLDGEELLTNLFKGLNEMALKMGMAGVVLPKDLEEPFNFNNRTTISGQSFIEWVKSSSPGLSFYTKGKPVKVNVSPEHQASWDNLTAMFGTDISNSIESKEFVMLAFNAAMRAKGGIDMNPAQMSLQVKNEGESFHFDFNGVEIDAAQVTGAEFIINDIKPVTNLLVELGLPLSAADTALNLR